MRELRRNQAEFKAEPEPEPEAGSLFRGGRGDPDAFRFVFVCLLAAVAAHVLLLLLFRPLKNSRESAEASPRFTIMLPMDREKNAEAVRRHGLGYWLAFFEPETAVRPNATSGFSAFEAIERRNYFRGSSVVSTTGVRPGHRDVPARSPRPLLRPLSVFDTGAVFSPASGRVPSASVSVPASVPQKAEFPQWKIGDGVPRAGLLFDNREAKTILAGNAQKVFRPTLVRIASSDPFLPPETTVVSSCGNPALDLLAERQLALFAADALASGREKRREILCSVLWNPPFSNGADGFVSGVSGASGKRNENEKSEGKGDEK